MSVSIPGYEIVRKIGQGGMATVYLAIQQPLEREVALKVMSPKLALDPSFGERFLREGRIIAKLSHPRIVQVFDVGLHDETHYLAMKFYPGGELKDHLKKGLTIPRILKITYQLSEALDFAHHNGYIHRDVKPENVLFTAAGDVVLSDFGIARGANSNTRMTQTGSVIGTPIYMSPEQAKGEELDNRSDIYSLGVLFYEMLTGEVPYQADSGVAIGIKHITEPIPTLEDKIALFQPMVDRFLAKDRDDRYQSGSEIIADLKQVKKALLASSSSESGTVLSPVIKSSGARKTSGRSKAGVYAAHPAAPKKSGKLLKGIAVVFILAAIAVGVFLYLDPMQLNLFDQKPPPVTAEKPAEDQLTDLLAQAKEAMEKERYVGPAGDNARLYLRRILKIQPGNEYAIAKLAFINQLYHDQVLVSINKGDLEMARTFQSKIEKSDPYYKLAQSKIDQAEEAARQQAQQPKDDTPPPDNRVSDLIALADSAMATKKWTEPENESALHYYRQVLEIDPENTTARTGVDTIFSNLVAVGRRAAEESNIDKAERYLTKAEAIYPNNASAEELKELIEKQHQVAQQQQSQRNRINALLQEANSLLRRGDIITPQQNNALNRFKEVLRLNPGNRQAQNGLEDAYNILIDEIPKDIRAGNFDSAQKKFSFVPASHQSWAYINNYLESERERTNKEREINQLIRDARSSQQSGQWPDAREKYERVLQLDSTNSDARQGIKEVGDHFIAQARALIENDDFEEAEAEIKKVPDSHPGKSIVSTELSNARRKPPIGDGKWGDSGRKNDPGKGIASPPPSF